MPLPQGTFPLSECNRKCEVTGTIRNVSGLHCIMSEPRLHRSILSQAHNGMRHVCSHTQKQKSCRTPFPSESTDLRNKEIEKLCWYLGFWVIFIVTVSDNISYYVSSTTVLRTLCTWSHLLLCECEKRMNSPCVHMRKTRLERTADKWQRED